MTREGLPESLKSELLVRSKVDEDTDELKARQELVRAKTPSQLASMSGLSDLPMPKKFDSLIRGAHKTKGFDETQR